MRVQKLAAILLMFVVFGLSPAKAVDHKGTREEAQAMSEKAAVLVKEDAAKAFAQFQDTKGGFVSGDLYVFVLDSKGTFVAHGAKPALVGKDATQLKDTNGFEFAKAFLAVKDAGWVDYKWPDPSDNNKVKDKSSYIVKVAEYAVGVGYYK